MHTYVQSRLPAEVARFLDRHNGQLQHHGAEPVAAQLLRDAAHDQLVGNRAHQEGDEHGDGLGEMRQRGEIHVAAEEVVDGNVPLAREFQPLSVSTLFVLLTGRIGGLLYQSHEFHQSE